MGFLAYNYELSTKMLSFGTKNHLGSDLICFLFSLLTGLSQFPQQLLFARAMLLILWLKIPVGLGFVAWINLVLGFFQVSKVGRVGRENAAGASSESTAQWNRAHLQVPSEFQSKEHPVRLLSRLSLIWNPTGWLERLFLATNCHKS